MRRASRLAAFSGANVITSEVAGALCASLQMRQSGFQPVHVSDSNGAPLCVVKNKNRLSVSRILLFGPEHHALQQEKQRQPRRRRPRQPDPHSVEPVRQGKSLGDLGGTCTELNQFRPRPPRLLKRDPVDNNFIYSEASQVIPRQEVLPDSTASALASEIYIPQDAPSAAIPELQSVPVSTPTQDIATDSSALSGPSHVAAVQPAPSVPDVSGLGMSTEASVSEHVASAPVDKQTAQWPYVRSSVQQPVNLDLAVTAQTQARSQVHDEQPGAASEPQAIFEDLQVAKHEAVAAAISERPSMLRMPNLHVDVTQSPLLRESIQCSEVEAPADMVMSKEKAAPAEAATPVDTLTADAPLQPLAAPKSTEAPVSADLRLSAPIAAATHAPSEGFARAPPSRHAEQLPSADALKPVSEPSLERGRLQAAHGSTTEDSTLLRTPVETKTHQSVLEVADVNLLDTYQPPTIGGGILHTAQDEPTADQVVESLEQEVAAPSTVKITDAEAMLPKKKSAKTNFSPFAFAANPTGVAEPRKFDQLFPHSPPVAQQSKKSLLKAARTQLDTGTSSLLSGAPVPAASAVPPAGALNTSPPAPPAISLLQKHSQSPDLPLLHVQQTGIEQPTGIEQARSREQARTIEQATSIEQATIIEQQTDIEPASVGKQRKLDLSQLGHTGSSLLKSREVSSFLKDGPAAPPPGDSNTYKFRPFAAQEQSYQRQSRVQQRREGTFKDTRVQDTPQDTDHNFQPAATQLSAMDMFKKMVQASSKGSANTRKKLQRQTPQLQQRQKAQPAAVQTVTITDSMTVRDLAVALHISPPELDSKLVELGEMLESEEDLVSTDAAELVALELGFECTIQTSDSGTDVRPRPPVVTIVGHVDHGKTTLLDSLRNSRVAEGEAGGITQHVGAFSVTMPGTNSKITFLDTPGHAAFSAMRARGTRVTDVAVLVVAADDGVMQTTREAIQHVKDANCSLIVALTKCDRDGARPESVEGELLGEGLELESAGGNVQVVHVAAPKGIGLRELEEAILLQAEMLGVSAPVDTLPEASVVESHVDRGQGPVAIVVVRQGVLKVGQPVVVGKEHGRIRSLHDPEGASVSQATPGVPVVVAGLKGVPHAGDVLRATSSESRARDIADARAARAQTRHHDAMEKLSQDHFDTVVDEETGTNKKVMKPSLPLMLYADVDGSLEALTTSLLAVNTGRIVYKVVSADVGPPSSRDVQTAMDTGACVVCFAVPVPTAVQRDADQRGVKTVQSDVIYKLLDTLSEQLVASAPTKQERVTTGEVEVAATFNASVKKSVSATGKVKIAGCKVLDGRIRRDAVLVRVKRMGQVKWEGNIRELKQAKNHVDQVGKGGECGIMLSGWEDFQVGDKLEILEMQAAKPKLSSTASGAVLIEG